MSGLPIVGIEPLDVPERHLRAAEPAEGKTRHADQDGPHHRVLLCSLVFLLLPLTVWASPHADEVYALLQRLAQLLAAPRAAPVTYYVAASGGSNNNSCEQARTASSAKATLNGSSGALACLASGDTLVLRDGVYVTQLADYADDEHPGVTRPPSGTSWSAPTTIRAEHPRQATLQMPPGPLSHVVSFGLPDTRYITIEGLVLDGQSKSTCVWFGPASPIRLINSHVRKCGGNGVYVDLTQGVELVNNLIEDVATGQTAPPGNHGIYYVGAYGLIKGNVIRNCPFLGIQASSEHGGLHHNVIEDNRVIGCAQSGIFSQGANTIIRNNLLEGNCIGIYLSSAPTAVLHNTIYGARTGPNCSDSYGIFDKSGGSNVGNNLVLQQHMAIYHQNVPPTLTTNLCDGHALNCQLTVPSATGVVVDGPGGNLTLATGSPAIGAATPAAPVPTDRLGVARPQGTGSDIGAYEYTGNAPPPTGDTVKPTAQITSPVAGAVVSGSVTIVATATDNVGVVGLTFKVDGVNLGTEDPGPTYSRPWETATATPGTHTLTAVARDAAGNVGQAPPITVTVAGSTPPPVTSLVLQCTGSLSAVPGTVTMECAPVVKQR